MDAQFEEVSLTLNFAVSSTETLSTLADYPRIGLLRATFLVVAARAASTEATGSRGAVTIESCSALFARWTTMPFRAATLFHFFRLFLTSVEWDGRIHHDVA